MKARIIIEYEGDFNEDDVKADVEGYREEIEKSLDDELNEQNKVNNFKVSYEVLE